MEHRYQSPGCGSHGMWNRKRGKAAGSEEPGLNTKIMLDFLYHSFLTKGQQVMNSILREFSSLTVAFFISRGLAAN